MKVKRSYALQLNQILQHAESIFDSSKPISGRFRYMKSYNLKKTEDERKLTLEAFPYDEKYLEYENKRQQILNEGGIHQNGDAANLGDEERAALEARIIKLRDEYADVIAAENEVNKDREEFLNEEIEIDLRTVTPDEVPDIIAEHDWEIWDLIEPIVRE